MRRRNREQTRGVRGHAPPGKFEILGLLAFEKARNVSRIANNNDKTTSYKLQGPRRGVGLGGLSPPLFGVKRKSDETIDI